MFSRENGRLICRPYWAKHVRLTISEDRDTGCRLSNVGIDSDNGLRATQDYLDKFKEKHDFKKVGILLNETQKLIIYRCKKCGAEYSSNGGEMSQRFSRAIQGTREYCDQYEFEKELMRLAFIESIMDS